MNSKRIKDFNISPKILKQPQEVAVNTLEHIDIEDDFLSVTKGPTY
jgi:hypothetical protein